MKDEFFFGRKRELKLLGELLEKRTSSLVVIKGRRRIGKTRLIQRFCKPYKHFRFVGLPPDPDKKMNAQDQRNEFLRQMEIHTGVRGLRAEDWGDLFWHLSQFTKEGQMIVVFDEINWMGSQDATFLSKLKTAWDEYFKLNPQLILILSGSMSTWIEKNILSSTGFFGRLSLELTLDELSLHDCNYFWSPFKDKISAFEKFKVLSVTGGVPRYLEEINSKITAEENIRRLCFRKEELMFHEFDRIFTDLFGGRSLIYKRIIRFLARANAAQSEIFKALEITKGGVTSDYLHDLVQTGYLACEHSWSLVTGEEVRLSHYRLKDNYLRFYLKYIEPNKAKIMQNKLKSLPAWDAIMGLQFENLVLNNRNLLFAILGISVEDIVYDNPYFQKQTKTHRGCQIDFLVQTKYNILYLVEIKFSQHPIESSVIDEVEQKIKRLNLGDRRFSIRPVLVHVNGVSESLKLTKYFTHCIDFGAFLEQEVNEI